VVELTLFERLRLRIFGSVPVGRRIKPSWSGPIMHYAFKCPKHGIVMNYPHGEDGRFDCLHCLEEKWKYA